ncbi:MAG: hypothetical protein J6U06_01135 [Spirochaetaceae bacterium]|nr:hypothetical protein [Spirochaetaceae bacterium]
MPGLNQLKNFVNNLQSLGNEASVRSARGETIHTLPFPENIPEADDSEDFLYGLPVKEEEGAAEETAAEAQQGDSSVPTTSEGDIDIDALLNSNIDGSVDTSAAAPEAAPSVQDKPAVQETSEPAAETSDLPDFGDLPDVNEEPVVESFDAPASGGVEADSSTAATDDFEMPSFDGLDRTAEASADAGIVAGASDDFEMPDFGTDFSVDDTSAAADGAAAASNTTGTDDSDFDLPDFGDFSAPQDDAASGAAEKTEAASAGASAADDFELPDFGSDFSGDEKPAATEAPATAATSSSIEFPTETDSLDLPDFDLDDQNNSGKGLDETPDVGIGGADFDMPDFGGDSAGDASASAEAPADDAKDDFSIEGFADATDAAEEPAADDFSIPGFSDVAEVVAPPKKKAAAAVDEKVEDNQFTDAEYQKFIENLNYYPLNLRVEIEKIFVEDQFNEEDNRKLVRMVIKKTPVRQLANHVGKMIDKVIDVPRNYEKRTAAQYEAYKQTTEYQLKNRIIPFLVACLAIAVLAGSTFVLGKTFIYEPVRAELLYKEGYTLLEGEYYPQSEEKFNAATEFKKKKDWFFKYARGYREKRQYERASQMYQYILFFFPKDKQGGLEYAEMKLYDERKYAEAEEIVRREVLDKFINDPDGLLLLGDVYLEWACNEDPAKFELARAQYETALDLYGQSDRYLAKMLRYYIRTDNLREVLPLKNYFYPDKKLGPKKIKALSAPEVLELSCYLLDKLYGELTPAEEYLRSYIEDVRALLERAIVADPDVPEAYYNYARYFIYTADISKAQVQLEHALGVFDKAKAKTKDRIFKNIDTYRLLGELYADQQEYLKAEEVYVKGISLFENERDSSNLIDNDKLAKNSKAYKEVGLLYADMADLDYFISGDNDNALMNYLHAVEYNNDTSSIRYRIGYIQYGKKNYLDALGSFIASSEENGNDLHLLLSLANTLSLRDDNFAAQGYYQRFVDEFAKEKALKGLLFPQVQAEDADLVETYMKATNNFGVTLGKLAFRTGDSNQNALAMVYMAESMRAWDALTRNQETMVRLDGSNLAAQNMQYLRYPISPFEPALYFDIPRTLQDEKILTQPTLKSTK